MDHFGTDAETVAVEANRKTITERQVIDFAPAVFTAASDGDAVAAAIVDCMADEVVTMAVTLLRRLDMLAADAEVVLGGGTLQGGHTRLLERIDGGVHAAAPNARISVLDVPPVCGAVVGALQLAGASPVTISTVREALRAPAPAGR
jgi:N-acetylglucosamine kinase-like BadF-type ATPase